MTVNILADLAWRAVIMVVLAVTVDQLSCQLAFECWKFAHDTVSPGPLEATGPYRAPQARACHRWIIA